MDAEKFCDYKSRTVLKRIIETISFKTPSPKMIANSFGCFLWSKIDTAATVSLLHTIAVINKIYIGRIKIGIGFEALS